MEQRKSAELGALIAEGESIAEGLRSLDMTGHELHGLRPWSTCRFCWRMSWFAFVENPARNRLRLWHHWLRPVVIRPMRGDDFVTREWRWSRRAVSQRELWKLARLRSPRGPWIHPAIYPLFVAWDANDGHLPDEAHAATA